MSRKLLASLILSTLLFVAPAEADTFRFGVMGDSLSDPYANYTGASNPMTGLPYWGYGGNKNWVEQLQALRPSSIVIDNQARAGATSADLIAQGQHTALADRIAHDNLRHAFLLIGANDVLAQLNAGGDPTPFLVNFSTNVRQAIGTLQAAGPVALVLANIPNVAATPVFQSLFSQAQLAGITALVQAANAQLDAIRIEQGLPLVDLYRLGQLAEGPLTLGGTTFEPLQLFAPDFFHPATPLQGLLANAYLEAEQAAYGTNVAALKLSDQEIAGLATGTSASGPASFLNVKDYVNFNASPEPSTLVLAGFASLIGVVWRRRLRRAA